MSRLIPLPKIAITAIIFIFLSAQITAIVLPVPAYYWPFTDYPMYSPPHFEGDAVNPSYTIIGVRSDGTEHPTTPKDFGLSVFQHHWWFVVSLLKNRDRDQVRTHINFLQTNLKNRFQHLRIEVHPYIISREGYSPGPVEVLKVIDVDTLEGVNE